VAVLAGMKPVFGQPDSAAIVQDKVFQIARESSAIVVDGVLDETEWRQATMIDDLHQIDPFEYAEPSEPTEIRIYYDENALYIAARMWDSEAESITANVLRQGEDLWSDDRFSVILDPYLDRRSGYRFQVNPNGVRWDALYQNVSNLESNWEGIWQAAATRDDDGWSAEMAIPFKTLSFNPNSTDWGINFERVIERDGENIGWVSRNRQMNPGVAGTVTGFQGLQQGMGLDIVPSMSVGETKTYGAAGTADSNFEPSLDVFYKITPSLNAALTVNTDFSATEVDDRQVNLTRFSLFFPEKRDFFLQDADIFEFGSIGGGGRGSGGGGRGNFNEGGSQNFAVPASALQNARPFFSRRIGLSETGLPVDLEYGGKLSGRVGRWNIGALAIRQDQFEDIEADDIFVGRLAANVLEESAVGIIMTDGDPQSNLDSSLLGADFRYRNSRLPGGRLLEGQAWYQKSDNEGIDSQNQAYGFGMNLPNSTGWAVGFETRTVEENFFPAVGFVDRVGIRDYAANFGYRLRFRDKWLRSFYTGFEGYRQDHLDTGELDSEILSLRISTDSNTQDRMFMMIQSHHEVLHEDFVIYEAPNDGRTVVIPPGDYTYGQIRMGGRSASHRKLSYGGNITTGDFYNGQELQTSVNFTWKPSERFLIGVEYRVNDIELPEGDFTVRLSSLTTQLVFSSTLSWVNLIQYDNLSENIGLNSRLHWVPQAGREGFIVFNHNLVDTDRNDSFHSVNADVSVKFSYTWRF
jgi:hypothetical protein